MRIASTGKIWTEEGKKKLSKAQKQSQTARAKNQNGCLNPMFNKKHSDETKKKMSEKAKARKVHGPTGKTWKRTDESKKQ